MQKLRLIIKREYLTRVTKRSFIISTILTPLALVVFFLAATYLMTYEGEEPRHVAVIDSSGILGKDSLRLNEKRGLTFRKVGGTVDNYKNDPAFDAVLELPPITDLLSDEYTVRYHSSEGIMGTGILGQIKGDIKQNIRQYKIETYGMDEAKLASLNTVVNIDRQSTSQDAPPKGENSSYTATALGGFMGVVMYFAVFFYGMMVMRSITEEKTNRIVEVMISSVKPFQLMMGKIIGVGLVGLTQVGIWGILLPVLFFSGQLMFGLDAEELQKLQEASAQMPGGADTKQTEVMVANFLNDFMDQNWLLIIPLFLIYFLGGYLMYSSLFAAVGSAMSDDMGEGQSLTIPITLPVLVAFYIMFAVVQNPNSSLATWSSMVPLFSPIVMPARLAFEPAGWEILLSVTILVASVVFFIWLSARIYRIGIFMYGKKVTFKELGKWIAYKD
jgi:ABC-2 type transport system permease protein